MRNWLFSDSDSRQINLCFPKVLRQKLFECFSRTRCGQARENIGPEAVFDAVGGDEL